LIRPLSEGFKAAEEFLQGQDIGMVLVAAVTENFEA
jgi:hypothetical protein